MSNSKPQFDDTYIVLKGWMRSKLALKGNNLMAFALVYGFCQDGTNTFDASLAFVKKWLGVSQPTAVSVMASLVDMDYLIKTDNGPGNPFTYTVNWQKINQLKNFTTSKGEPVKKLNTHQLKNFTGGSKKTLLNIDTNSNKDRDREHTPKKSPQENTKYMSAVEAFEYAKHLLRDTYSIQFEALCREFKGKLTPHEVAENMRDVLYEREEKGMWAQLMKPENEHKEYTWLTSLLARTRKFCKTTSKNRPIQQDAPKRLSVKYRAQ